MSELFAAFGINWKLLMVQGLNFALLLMALTYFLYKPVMNMLDERQKRIAEGVKTAQDAQKRLEDATHESESIVGSAAREAEGLVSAANKHAQEKQEEMLKAAEKQAQSIIADAQARAEEEKRQALLSSEREIARAAMLAAEKILREKA